MPAKTQALLSRAGPTLRDACYRKGRKPVFHQLPMHICAYRGYASPMRVFVSGRVLANRAPGELREKQSLWRNILDAYRRFETDEMPNAEVAVRFEDQEHTVRTDVEGYYHFECPRARQSNQLWLKGEARCKLRGQEISATHAIVAPGSDAEFGVISDLDDTVIETNMTSFLTAV